MNWKRKYVQFNDLVIDNYDMTREIDTTDLPFKYNSHEYSFGHGSYAPMKQDYMFAGEASVSLTMYLKMKKLHCEYRPYYRRFAIGQLAKPGRLWAVVGNELLWAWAFVTNYGEIGSEDTLEINVDFTLPEGLWHKANKAKTFMRPFDICEFMECYDFHDVNPCRSKAIGEGVDCCTECYPATSIECNCCWCNEITEDMALCYADLSLFYNDCTAPYQIAYDCVKGEQFFADEFLGTKICNGDSCNSIIAGQFYSDTDVPTKDVTLIINTQVKNPIITINGNTNIFKGTYNKLKILPSGDVYELDDCGCETLLDPTNWTVPENSSYGFTIHQGNNSVIVDTGVCCFGCIYISADSLTF